ncbi:MAG: serine hydrolase [Planctomycetota bacterium]|jgi:hypothetical protein
MQLASLFLALPLMLAGESELDAMARKVADQIVANPGKIAGLYHPVLLAQISEGKLKDLYQGFHKQHGKVISITPQERTGNTNGKFDLSFEKNVKMAMTISISTTTPAKVNGIWFGPPTQRYETIGEAVKDLAVLPGTVSFQLAKLGQKTKVLHEINGDTPLAIGSTFKLYILASLVQDQKPWDEVIRLSPDYKSLPSGTLQKWPNGAPVTVHTLATAMISVSDNTATDHLLNHVGRKRVERIMATTGNENAEKSVPFLSTLEMFKLKSDAKLLKRFIKRDVKGRRKLLSGKMQEMDRTQLAPFPDGTPLAIDSVEWFASASDLVRLMSWFHERDDNTALDVMAVNKGLDARDEYYDYVGYKGGSEPGVLNMTWLLKTKSGDDLVLSAGWNNPDKAGTDLVTFSGIMQSILDLIGKGER